VLSQLLSTLCFAGLSRFFTLDGRLTTSDGTTPLLDSNVQLTLQILNPAQNCILYEEIQTVDTSNNKGSFNIQVGAETSSSKRSPSGDSGNSMTNIYSNLSAISGKNLTNYNNCIYNPTSGDERYLRIIVVNSNDGIERVLSPNMLINSVPNSLIANTAETFQGLLPNQFLNLATTPNLTQNNVENIFSTINYSRLVSLLSVPQTYYIQSGVNGTIGISQVAGNPTTGLSTGQMWYDSIGNNLKYYDGTTTKILETSTATSSIISFIAGTGLTGGTITGSGQTIAIDIGNTAGKIVQVQSGNKLPVLDGSNLTQLNASAVSGTLGGSLAVSTSGNIQTIGDLTSQRLILYDHTGVGPGFVGFIAPSIVASSTIWTLPNGDGTNGQVLSTNGSGILSWTTVSAGSGSGITNVTAGNGLLGGSITTIGTFSVNTGTGVSQIVQLDGSAKLPILDGSQLINLNLSNTTGSLNLSNTSGSLSVIKGGTGLSAGTSGGIPYYLSNNTMASSPVLSLNGIIYGGGAAGSPLSTAAMTDGQLLVGKTGFAPQVVLMNGDATISSSGSLTLISSGISAGTYIKVIVDNKGRVVSSSSLGSSDITAALGYTPSSSSGTISTGNGLLGGPISTNGTISINAGTGINQIALTYN
jgi:hypothetical protein